MTLLWMVAVVMELCLAGMAWFGDLRQHVLVFLPLFGIAFAAFLAAAMHLQRRSADHIPWWFLLGWAMVFRLTLLPVLPTLSDDIYRYLWDGRVQLAGINPYTYPPNAPELAFLRDAAHAQINHPDIRTIYPPLAQAMFRLGAALHPSVWAQKLVFAGWDLAILALLSVWLAGSGRQPWLLLYAWHPLVIVEFAGSGHNDALGLFWLLAAVWAWERPDIGRGRALAGSVLAFLSKFAGLVLWPWMWLREPRLRRWRYAAAVAMAAGVPLWWTGRAWGGLNHYAGDWEFNSLVYGMLASWTGTPWLARSLCLALMAVVVVWSARRAATLRDYLWRCLAAAVLLTPVLEPWYVCWLIPLLCFQPRLSWLVFTGLVALSYWVLHPFVTQGQWLLPAWVTWVEYGGLAALLIWERYAHRVDDARLQRGRDAAAGLEGAAVAAVASSSRGG